MNKSLVFVYGAVHSNDNEIVVSRKQKYSMNTYGIIRQLKLKKEKYITLPSSSHSTHLWSITVHIPSVNEKKKLLFDVIPTEFLYIAFSQSF